jgi:two-component system, NarL family, response regulator
MQNPKFLLVTSDPELGHRLGGFFEKKGCNALLADSEWQAALLLDRHRPHLVVLDLISDWASGVCLAKRIKEQVDVPMLVLIDLYDDRTCPEEVYPYAEDYVIEPFDDEELWVRAQRVLHQTGLKRNQAMTGRQEGCLTARQKEVLQLAATGATDNEIAVQLTISAQTVSWHMARIRTRLGVRSRTQAVVQAIRQGLLSLK